VDPDETLREAREALDDYFENQSKNITGEIDAADRLAEAFAALDTWLMEGGFLPTPWLEAASDWKKIERRLERLERGLDKEAES
jgi:hypothetical protein